MIGKFSPRLMLFSRITLFFSLQALFMLGFLLGRSPSAWMAGAAWWPLSVAIADAICLVFLIRLFKIEGKRFWDLFRIERAHLKRDLLALLGMTILITPVSILPNIWLGQALFGNSAAIMELFVQPLPRWAVYTAIFLFPILQGLTETPTYFGYVMPRLEAQSLSKWLAVSLSALMLGLQHLAMPLILDLRFVLWRGLMFIPFAFVVGIAFHWRPRLLPYFAVIHVLMNMSFVTMFLSAAY